MDKDNRDDFTFAKLSDLRLPVTFRMFVLSDQDIHHIESKSCRQIAARGNTQATFIHRAARETRAAFPWRSAVPVGHSHRARLLYTFAYALKGTVRPLRDMPADSG